MGDKPIFDMSTAQNIGGTSTPAGGTNATADKPLFDMSTAQNVGSGMGAPTPHETDQPQGFLGTVGSDIVSAGKGILSTAEYAAHQFNLSPEEKAAAEARMAAGEAHKTQVYGTFKDNMKTGNYVQAFKGLGDLFTTENDDPNDPVHKVIDAQIQSSKQAKDRMIQSAKQGDTLGVIQHAAGIVPIASQVDEAMTNYQRNPTRENLAHVVTAAIPAFVPSMIRGVAKAIPAVSEVAGDVAETVKGKTSAPVDTAVSNAAAKSGLPVGTTPVEAQVAKVVEKAPIAEGAAETIAPEESTVQAPLQQGIKQAFKDTATDAKINSGGSTQITDAPSLQKTLLERGGNKVAFNAREAGSVERLGARGQFWDGADAEQHPMEGSNCHANSVQLMEEGKGDVTNGLALSKDGVWRPHTWVTGPNGVIETTTPRQAYFGTTLTRDEVLDEMIPEGRSNYLRTLDTERLDKQFPQGLGSPKAGEPLSSGNAPTRNVASDLQKQVYTRAKAGWAQLDEASGGTWQRFNNEIENLKNEADAQAGIDDEAAIKAEQKATALEAKRDAMTQRLVKDGKIDANTEAQAKADWNQQLGLQRVDKVVKSNIRPATANTPETVKNVNTLENQMQRLKDNRELDRAMGSPERAQALLDHINNANDALQKIKDFEPQGATGKQMLKNIIQKNTIGKSSLIRGGKVVGNTDWNGVVKDFENLGSQGQKAAFGDETALARKYIQRQALKQNAIDLLVGKTTAGKVIRGVVVEEGVRRIFQ